MQMPDVLRGPASSLHGAVNRTSFHKANVALQIYTQSTFQHTGALLWSVSPAGEAI